MPTKAKRRTKRGYRFVVDKNGDPSAVIIDLKKHRRLWEDFQDLLVCRARRNEPRISLAEMDARLRKAGKLGRPWHQKKGACQ